jgi:hypothetical protein
MITMKGSLRMLVLAAALSVACTAWPWRYGDSSADASAHLEFLLQALAADAAKRETFWRATSGEPLTEDAALRKALLRTVPGHSGYDPVLAERELQAVLAREPSREIAPVARLRLEELRSLHSCRIEVDSLKKRLAKVADIERKLDRKP